MAPQTLATYRLECRRLLHDATGKFWSDSELNDYINDARNRVCSDTGCLRRLITAYLSLNHEQYPIGAVTGATIVDGGSGYISPTVSFTGGGGSGAAATLGVTAGVITSITFTNYGSGYTSAPTAVIAPVSGGVSSVTVVGPGAYYTAVPTVSFTGGGGVGAAASAFLGVNGNLGIGAGGAGYTVGDIVTLSGGTFTRPAKILVTAIFGGAVNGLALVDPGAYSVIPANNVPTTGGTGAGYTASVFWSVSAITVTAAGSGYTSAPAVTVQAIASLVQATATAAVSPALGAASITVGVIPADTLDIMNITPIWGNQRIPLNYMPFTEFNAKLRTWFVNPQLPRVWSRYGTSGGTAFIQPIPDRTYNTEFDTAILPEALVLDATADVLAYPYTTPVAYYACWKAKIKQQAFAESETFLADYKRKIMEAQAAVQMRRIPNPYAGYTGG